MYQISVHVSHSHNFYCSVSKVGFNINENVFFVCIISCAMTYTTDFFILMKQEVFVDYYCSAIMFTVKEVPWSQEAERF